MEKNKIDNLIKFTFLFHKNCDCCNIFLQSPDYILEKYNIFFKSLPKSENKEINKVYKDIWFNETISADKTQLKTIELLSPILRYLFSINSRHINYYNAQMLYEEYKNILNTEINNYEINNIIIHPNLRDSIDIWKMKDIRSYNLLLLN
jgi:hypothetical protein